MTTKNLVDGIESQEESLKQPSPLETVEDFTTSDTVHEKIYEIDPRLDCIKDQKCPDCGVEDEILEGPSAPSCTNVKCGKCGSRFNITPHGVHRL